MARFAFSEASAVHSGAERKKEKEYYGEKGSGKRDALVFYLSLLLGRIGIAEANDRGRIQ